MLGPLAEPEPGEDARRAARCGLRLDLDEASLNLGQPQRLRPGVSLGKQQLRSRSAASTVSSGVPSSLGASWARNPMRQRRGNSIVPSSGCSTPRIRSRRVDFPAPLRPTNPTFAPS